MKKLLLFILVGLISHINLYSTRWDFGGLDGEAGLIILYKTLPPLIVEVEKPEVLKIPKTNKSFKYSETVSKNTPLNVNIEVIFDNKIINKNGINKEIVRTIYNEVELSFDGDGKFKLDRVDNSSKEKIKEKTLSSIDGEVFFTNRNGVTDGDGKKVKKILGDTIKDGKLKQDDIYIDAIFNSELKSLNSGRYIGKATLIVEFIGKGAIN